MDGQFYGQKQLVSILTTLNGEVARGYVDIPQVERAAEVHLCPANASPFRNYPHLPSKACKLSVALAASQATPALHAMAILQVHQAKALKKMHEDSTDPRLMQELRMATDFALRVTKVMVWSLGKATSKSDISGSTWLRWELLTKCAFLMLPSPRLVCSATLSRTFAQHLLAVADWGYPAHPTLTWSSSWHSLIVGHASVCSSLWASSCVLQSHSPLCWDKLKAGTLNLSQ